MYGPQFIRVNSLDLDKYLNEKRLSPPLLKLWIRQKIAYTLLFFRQKKKNVPTIEPFVSPDSHIPYTSPIYELHSRIFILKYNTVSVKRHFLPVDDPTCVLYPRRLLPSGQSINNVTNFLLLYNFSNIPQLFFLLTLVNFHKFKIKTATKKNKFNLFRSLSPKWPINKFFAK